MKNWWYYHKWYVVCGVILLFAAVDLAGAKFGWFRDKPDVQLAYIGAQPLSEQAAAALEEQFSSLAEDYNHDGKVFVKLNQFASSIPGVEAMDRASYQQAAELSLFGDIEQCDSYFFLMENPDAVQKEFQILANPDGSCPEEHDLSAEDKVVEWDFGLYLGRRCFYNKKRTPYADECGKLWEKIADSKK